MNPVIPFTQTCRSSMGRFQVKIEPATLFLGGVHYCVNLMLDSDVTWLNWLSTDQGGCELDSKLIRKESTVQMVDLAFSLLRTYFPGRNMITLMDGSGFSWEGPRRTKYKVNFLNGYALLYGKTWYEDKFGATMVDEHAYQRYREQIAIGFDDPSRKPSVFSFGRAEAEMMPLYQSSTTWREFVEKLKTTYPEDKYKHMLDWYRQAVFYILGGMEINQNWKIDLSTRPMYSCEWMVHGGTRPSRGKKRRTAKKRRFTFSVYHPLPPFQEDKQWVLQ